jgi:SAM-dependent methyltransferase
MLRYYGWAAAEKALSLTPGGKRVYRSVGEILRSRTRGTGCDCAGGANSFPLVRKAKETVPRGGTILDVGTGYYHHDAFLLHLAGEWQVKLFDIEDRARMSYIQNYLRWLLDHLDEVCAGVGLDEGAAGAELETLLALPSREAIYQRCNFTLHTPDDLTKPFLPVGSVDFMLSNCVLVHVRPEILVAELVALRDMLADDGVMFHMLGHDDHWAFHDPAVPWPSFNYLRYSDRAWRLFFDTKLEYHNRLVKPEWLDVFSHAGLRVLDYEARIDDRSRESVQRLPRIAERYASYPLDDLAIYYSYVLLAKA